MNNQLDDSTFEQRECSNLRLPASSIQNLSRTLGFLILAISQVIETQGAETNSSSALITVDRIFSAGEFDAETPSQVFWRKSGPGYYTWEKPASGSGRDLVLVEPESGTKEVILPAHAFQIPGGGNLNVERFEFSKDESKVLLYTNSKKVWRTNTRGDYWVLDVTTREARKLGGEAPASTMMFAKFSPDGTHIGYVRRNNIYVQNLKDLSIIALTSDGSETLINGTFDWVYEEELYLKDGFIWSPDSRSIAFWQLDSSGVRKFPLINNTDTFYPEITWIPYPKTGEANSSGRIGVISSTGGNPKWLSIPGDPRNHYLARMSWVTNSSELVIQQFNRAQTTNWVMRANAASGEVESILREIDSAWVENENPIWWIEKGESFLWLSERDGWAQLYKVDRAGGNPKKLTRSEFDVISVESVDEKDGWVYFIASPERPTERYLFRVRLSGGKPEQITPKSDTGTHAYSISTDSKWAVHTYSRMGTPPLTELVRLPEHKSIRMMEENKKLKEKLSKLNLPTHEFFRVTIEDGIELDGSILRPPDFDQSKKYPVLFYVYGEPAGQTVTDSWQGRRYLWHSMLAQDGYIVISVDNRGTPAPRGRNWRRALSRKIGILNPADQAAATRAIIKRWSYVDTDRIAIWGWSGGGSSTLNALFQYPDLYKVGMSIAPVPNQRFYDTIYQERYMGLPEENVEAYRKGSPITHAKNLKGSLLLIHGTGDDNVHYQGMEALINELIAHNKKFTMMAYPNRSHSISEGPNTTRHLHHLLTQYLMKEIPPNSAETKKP